jgi:hypothetical protein
MCNGVEPNVLIVQHPPACTCFHTYAYVICGMWKSKLRFRINGTHDEGIGNHMLMWVRTWHLPFLHDTGVGTTRNTTYRTRPIKSMLIQVIRSVFQIRLHRTHIV